MNQRLALFYGAVFRRLHEGKAPTAAELAEWMRNEFPQEAEPWARRLLVIPEGRAYPPLPSEEDLHAIHVGQRDRLPENPQWWTPGSHSVTLYADTRGWPPVEFQAAARLVGRADTETALDDGWGIVA